MIRPSRVALPAVLIGAALAPAQGTKVVPPAYALKPGSSLDVEPFGVDQIRHATWIDVSNLTGLPASKQISEVRYRREENRLDKVFSTYEPMHRDPATGTLNWRIRMANSTTSYTNLVPQYENRANGVAAWTTVFAAALDLNTNTPTIPYPTNPANPAPFSITFPFNVQPFTHNGTNLVVEHYAYASRNRTHIYYIDAVESQPNNGGTVDLITPSSLGCPQDANRVHGTAPNPGAGNVDLHLFGAPNSVPVVCYFGASSTLWNGVPLPLSLAFMGLTGCNVYTDLTFPVAAQTNAFGVASLSIPVPANSAYINASLYSQWGVADQRVNPNLGFAMSDGVKITLGSTVGQETIAMSVISGQAGAASGTVGFLQLNRGPVMELVHN